MSKMVKSKAIFVCLVAALLSGGVAVAGNEESGISAKPFVKWVGGKNQLIPQLSELLPSDLATRRNLIYVEPFVGGGAMLFHMLSTYTNITHVIINDLNTDLITTYRTVRNNPDELIERLRLQQDNYRACADDETRKSFYLAARERYNQGNLDATETAAIFIFLNRTCFNGLYRVNAKGKFNVPFGKAVNPLICNEKTIRADSVLLRKVEILNGDFETVLSKIKRPAFFYFDPPYRPLTDTAAFTAYSKDGFGDDQQRRLGAFCRKLDAAGHQWLLSNSDPHNVNPNDNFFEELYSGFEMHRVSASRMINSKGGGRGKISELAIRNYH